MGALRDRWQKVAAASVAAVLLGGAIFTGTAYLAHRANRSAEILPPLASHSDVPSRPLTTFADSLKATLPSDDQKLRADCLPQNGNWISRENQNPGIDLTPADWRTLHLYQESGSVLWIDRQSVTCGEKIGIHASLFPINFEGAIDKTPRRFEVLRIGWYNGSGARMMWNSGPIKLKRRNVPTLKNLTRTVETTWPASATFDVGADWTPGLYVVASVNQLGRIENLAPFILRSSDSSSKILLIHSTLTWSAYNSFGGHSTYTAIHGGEDGRSKVASLDRPYGGSGISHIERDALSFVQYLESTGLNIDQTTDIDLSHNPSLIKGYNELVMSGHPEYMTRREFDTLLASRNLGVNIAFMGANSAYWQVRTESSPTGPDRHLVIYRNPRVDPQTNWQQISIQFGDSRINTPPSLLTGEVTGGVHVTGTLFPAQIPTWLKIPAGESLSGWSPNSEIDSIASGRVAPQNPHLIFSGKFSLVNASSRTNPPHRSLMGQTIWFTTPSGSATFVSGINYWPCEVSPTCAESTVPETTRSLLQSITSQVLTLWQTKAVGKTLK